MCAIVLIMTSTQLMPDFKLVSWSLMSLFSTNMAISETKGQGGELSLPSEGRLVIY